MSNVESNVHVKVAMADVLALFVISMFTFAVAIFGLNYGNDPSGNALIIALGMPVGILSIVAALFAYMNENLLGTAIFGPLAVFFIAIAVVPTLLGAAVLCMVIGIIILIDALVAFFQPVKLLPILLLVAAIAFFVTAMWYNGNATDKSNLSGAVGGLWLIYSLISFYMAAAIMVLVMKGKAILPLLIKA
jgi:succinate-acetate transporter protein